MIQIALNPGFALLLAMPLTLLAPRGMRPGVMALASAGALALLLTPAFGGHGSFAQIGLEVVPLRLDALSQVFGIAFTLGAAIVALSADSRAHPLEDGAILTMAGGATAALFAGDLVSFVAGIELASLAGAWIIFAAGGDAAVRAGARYLLWQAFGGLFLLAGVAFHLADGFGSAFERLPADSAGGALFLIGLAVKAGAPLAHLWVKDAAPRASPAGAAALTVFGAPLAIYALARAFAGESIVHFAGLAMALIFAVLALAEDDLKRAIARSHLAQLGLCAALIGLGSPMAIAAAAAHAFAISFAYPLMTFAIGVIASGAPAARASQVRGAARTYPLTSALYLIGAAAAAGVPGLIGFTSQSAAIEAFTRGGAPWLPFVGFAVTALTAMLTLIRTPFPFLFAMGQRPGAPILRGPPAPWMGMALSAFFCVAVGALPWWLYGLLPPAPLALWPFSLPRIVDHAETLGAACAVYAAWRLLRPAPSTPWDIRDLDALYAGPIARALHVAGGVALRLFEAAGALVERTAAQLGAASVHLAERLDRPHDRGAWSALSALAAIALALCAALSGLK